VLAFTATGAALLLWPAHDETVLEHHHEAMKHDHLHVHDEHRDHGHDHWDIEVSEAHSHPHRHGPLRHSHPYVINLHHPVWPKG
jgi:hypothetical protein